MDGKIGETIPFEIESVNDYIGKEFYLMVSDKNFTDRIQKLREKRKEKIRYKLKEFFGKKSEIKPFPQGTLIEIYRRTPRSIEGYTWADAEEINFIDGEPVNSKILDEIYKSYIFVPEKIETENKLTLTGIISEHHLCNNKIDKPLENKVKVTLVRIPKNKQYSIIGCF